MAAAATTMVLTNAYRGKYRGMQLTTTNSIKERTRARGLTNGSWRVMQNRRREGRGEDDESYCHVKRTSEGAPRELGGEIYKKSGSTTGDGFNVIGV